MWSIRDAKSRLSELIALAEENPQTISNRGNPQAVLVNIREYENMKDQLQKLKKFMKRQRVNALQEKIYKSFDEECATSVEFEKTPTRPLPEFK